MRERPIIAIDGPSGAGKTTASRLLAKRTSLARLDTGAMYRACALAANRAGIPWSDGERLGRLCESLPLEFRRAEGGELALLLSGEEIGEEIRTPAISMGASEVSAHPRVREAMVALQRRMGDRGGMVLEGRDTGTVVFPDADAKFFLDAHAATRALRRYREWGAGRKPYEEVFLEVLKRDIQDSTREHSPLRVAGDAVYIDTTTLSADEVVDEMLRRLPDSVKGALSR